MKLRKRIYDYLWNKIITNPDTLWKDDIEIMTRRIMTLIREDQKKRIEKMIKEIEKMPENLGKHKVKANELFEPLGWDIEEMRKLINEYKEDKDEE